MPVTSDPRLWSVDRLHASSVGHERIAAGFCHALGPDGIDGSWADPFPTPARKPPHALIAAEVAWVKTYFTPWGLGRSRPTKPDRASRRGTMASAGGSCQEMETAGDFAA